MNHTKRTRRAFRPEVDPLEGRLVLSSGAAAQGAHAAGGAHLQQLKEQRHLLKEQRTELRIEQKLSLHQQKHKTAAPHAARAHARKLSASKAASSANADPPLGQTSTNPAGANLVTGIANTLGTGTGAANTLGTGTSNTSPLGTITGTGTDTSSSISIPGISTGNIPAAASPTIAGSFPLTTNPGTATNISGSLINFVPSGTGTATGSFGGNTIGTGVTNIPAAASTATNLYGATTNSANLFNTIPVTYGTVNNPSGVYTTGTVVAVNNTPPGIPGRNDTGEMDANPLGYQSSSITSAATNPSGLDPTVVGILYTNLPANSSTINTYYTNGQNIAGTNANMISPSGPSVVSFINNTLNSTSTGTF